MLSRGLRGGDWPTPERSQPNSPPEWPQCGASSPMVGLDGSTALRKAVVDVLDHPLIQRCQLHKVRNVKDHLPQRLQSSVGRRMTDAYHASSALEAEAALLALAKELDRTHPGPAASLGEGLHETLTVLRLGVPPTLARTLRSTNCIESMISGLPRPRCQRQTLAR